MVVSEDIRIVFCSVKEDEGLQRLLGKQLRALQQQGRVSIWCDQDVAAGMDRKGEIEAHLVDAQIILLLVSPDFISSEFYSSDEMQLIMGLHVAGKCVVIPVLLRPVDWQGEPFAQLRCLPANGQPVTVWPNSDMAFLDIEQGIRNVIARSFPSALSIPQKGLPSVLLGSKDENRREILRRVRSIWIEGILNHSLHQETLVLLGLREKPEALQNQWRPFLLEIDNVVSPIADGTPIWQVCEKAGQKLLILGEPGSGKTTLLLELASYLLDQADLDANARIPVVFNLASWAEKRLPLAEWLVDELFIRYEVPRWLGQGWVFKERIHLLLDGLDEVSTNERGKCIQAINRYRQEHSSVPIVVGSRSSDYANEPVQLQLNSAVVVQPLTVGQIDDYLNKAEGDVEPLRDALTQGPDLQKLATVPLMLNVLIIAYQQQFADEIALSDTLEEKQKRVFASYVQYMLKRRGRSKKYSSERTLHWLARMARQMKRQGQAVFYIERMQPDWLERKSTRRLYRLVSKLCIGFTCTLLIFLISYTVSLKDIAYQFPKRGMPIPVIFLIFGFIFTLFYPVPLEIKPAEVVQWSWKRVMLSITPTASLKKGLLNGLLSGLLFSAVLLWLSWLFHDWKSVLNYIAVFGLLPTLAVGFISGFAKSFLEERALAHESDQEGFAKGLKDSPWLAMRWKSIRNSISVGLISGLVGGVPFGIFVFMVLLRVPGDSYEMGLFVVTVFVICVILISITFIVSSIISSIVFGFTNVVEKRIPFKGLFAWCVQHLLQGSIKSEDIRKSILAGLFTSFFYVGSPKVDYVLILFVFIIFFLLFFWFLNRINKGLSIDVLPQNALIKPNQGIYRSLNNGVRSVLFFYVCGGLLVIVMLTPVFATQETSWVDLIEIFLIVGVLAGITMGMANGGAAYIQHYVLRGFLWVGRAIPWRYSQFLDYAAERVFLQKLGGGYIFLHRMLLEYFASIESEADAPVETVQESEKLADASASVVVKEEEVEKTHLLPHVVAQPAQASEIEILPCGHEMRSSALFCSECGTRVAK